MLVCAYSWKLVRMNTTFPSTSTIICCLYRQRKYVHVSNEISFASWQINDIDRIEMCQVYEGECIFEIITFIWVKFESISLTQNMHYFLKNVYSIHPVIHSIDNNWMSYDCKIYQMRQRYLLISNLYVSNFSYNLARWCVHFWRYL